MEIRYCEKKVLINLVWHSSQNDLLKKIDSVAEISFHILQWETSYIEEVNYFVNAVSRSF